MKKKVNKVRPNQKVKQKNHKHKVSQLNRVNPAMQGRTPEELAVMMDKISKDFGKKSEDTPLILEDVKEA